MNTARLKPLLGAVRRLQDPDLRNDLQTDIAEVRAGLCQLVRDRWAQIREMEGSAAKGKAQK